MTPDEAYTVLRWLWLATGALVALILIWAMIRRWLGGATPPTLDVMGVKPVDPIPPPPLERCANHDQCPYLNPNGGTTCSGCSMNLNGLPVKIAPAHAAVCVDAFPALSSRRRCDLHCVDKTSVPRLKPPTLDLMSMTHRPMRCALCSRMTATRDDWCYGCHTHVCPDCNEEPQGKGAHSPLAHMAPHDNGGSNE